MPMTRPEFRTVAVKPPAWALSTGALAMLKAGPRKTWPVTEAGVPSGPLTKPRPVAKIVMTSPGVAGLSGVMRAPAILAQQVDGFSAVPTIEAVVLLVAVIGIPL